MATGNEILNYQGNAALGYSAADTPFISGQGDYLAPLNRTLDRLATQNFQWNLLKYQQKVKDRDDVLGTLSENNIDVDVLDPDRELLEKKTEEIWDIYRQNPDVTNNPQAFAEIKKKSQEFKNMANSAKLRSVEIKKMQADYAENTDAEYRQALGQHIQTQLNQGIYHTTEPFQKLQDWNLDNILVKVAPSQTDASTLTERNGIWYRGITTRTPLKDFFTFYDPTNMQEGFNKNLPNQIAAFYENARNNPDFMSDRNLNMINGVLADVNKAEGTTQASPYYVEPIATRREDGTWELTDSPAKLAMGVSLLKYYQKPKTEEVNDEKAQKAGLARAQTLLANEKRNTERATQGLRGAQAGAQRALSGKYNAEAERARKAGDKDALETAMKRQEGAKPVEEMAITFNSAFNRKDYKPVPANLAAELQQNAGIDANWEVSSIPIRDPGASKILAKPVYDADGRYKGVGKPDEIFAARPKGGSMNQTILIGRYNGTKKNPANGYIVMDPDRSIGAIINHDDGYTRNPKALELANEARFVVQEQTGSAAQGTDVEALIKNMGVVNSDAPMAEPTPAAVPSFTGGAPAAAPAQPKAAAARSNAIPVTKVNQTADLRKVNGKIQIWVGGRWRNVKGRKEGNILYE